MQESVRKYLTKLKESRKLSRRNQLVMLAVGLLVVSGVFGMLIMPGLGQEGNLVCGKTEHTHSESCEGLLCTVEEHTHTESCEGLLCTVEEHTHTEACKKLVCESTEEGHEHTEDCYVNNCGKDEHTHSDACYSSCDKQEHTHDEDLCYGYTCGTDEHEHSEECYEQAESEENAAIMLLTTDGDDQTGDDTSNESTINEGLVLGFNKDYQTTTSGERLYVTFISNYSKANDTGTPVTVKLEMGEMPEGISLADFVNGERTVTLTGAEGDEDQQITLKIVTGEKKNYIEYEQPQGSTLEFTLQFVSKNGITENDANVTLKIDENNITNLDSGTKVSIGEGFYDTSSLTWTAKNVWKPVVKTVNDEEENTIAVTAENTLSGKLTYVITAQSDNRAVKGVIWTKEIKVKDTLTLPKNIYLPEGATVSGEAVVTSSGEKILSFEALSTGEVLPTGTNVSLALSDDRKTISYSLTVPNTYMSDNVPTQEQKDLELKMVLNAELLTLPRDYNVTNSVGKIETDAIKNEVTIQPIPYHGDEKDPTTDSVTTIPEIPEEEWSLVKTANTESVEAGDVITYTLTLENTGETPIKVKKEDGTFYTVTDVLPKQLCLTDKQFEALPDTVDYDSDTRTITWTPSKTAIRNDDEICKIEFAVTVDSDAVKSLANGAQISNTASFKDSTSTVGVTFKKPYLTIAKTSVTEEKDSSVHDGEEITYTIVVENPTELDYKTSETVVDTLPAGLTVKSVSVGNTALNIAGDSRELHNSDENCKKEHTITYTAETNSLKWDIGCLAAHESVTISFVCTVDMDSVDNGDAIYNTARLTDGTYSRNRVGIEYPIEITKSVEENTAVAYSSGQIFHYTITVVNNEKYPSEKKNLDLVDTLPQGLLPYPEENGDGVLYLANEENETVEVISWSKFAAGEYTGTTGFYTTVDGRKADVTRTTTGQIKLTWHIEDMSQVKTITLTYLAQMTLTEEQQATGTAYAFKNIATIDNLSSSVIVKGGTLTGNLTLYKTFSKYFLNGTFESVTLGDKDTDSNWNIQFVITLLDDDNQPLLDADGNPVSQRIIEMQDFTGPTGDDVYQYEIKNLPVGTYKIEERNYTVEEGNESTTEYMYWDEDVHAWATNQDSIIFDIQENKTLKMDIENKSCPPETVKFQKSVYEIGQQSSSAATWTSIPEKYTFSVDSTGKTYVVYNITVSVLGGNFVTINQIEDQLPEGLKYIGLCSTSSYSKKSSAFSQEISISKNSGFNNAVKVENGNIEDAIKYTGSDVTRNYKISTVSYDEETNKVVLSVGWGPFNRIYGGCSFSFGMLCEVESDVVLGQELTNTAELTVTGAEEVSDKEYKTTNTPYDANQNNGESVLKSDNATTGQKVISSSVSILPENTVVPGIEKKVVSYMSDGSSVEIGEYDNIDPNSAVKWEITIYNDGTQSLKNYTVQDVVTEPFHLITEAEATALGIDAPYIYTVYIDKDGALWEKTIDIKSMVWEDIQNGDEVSDYTFDFTGDSSYTIPTGGYAVLTLYTNNTDGGKNIYTNTATIYPKEEFDANRVQQGELVKNSSTGQYVGVKSSDQVYALGEYASVSWKTITETKDSTNTAKGTWSKNYIFVEEDSQYVTYTNNVRNISSNGFNQFVVIDLMPLKNDTGVVNRNDIRGSEFKVLYDPTVDMSVTVVDASGKVVDDSPSFTLEFSNRTSFTQSDFNGADSDRWHKTYTEGDCSFRVKLDPEYILNPQETLVIQYGGKIEDAAVPGAIAWNSFGYQYYLTKEPDKYLRAEPPKVGVMIPAASIIQKEVIDAEGNIQDVDAGVTFTFAIYEKAADGTESYLGEFTLCQGGYSCLDELKDTDGNVIALNEGTEYVIKELTDEEHMPEGYELVGISVNDGTLSETGSFVYQKVNAINILARNQVEQYTSELPDTGAISALTYKAVGILLVLLAGLLCSCRLIIRRKQRNL